MATNTSTLSERFLKHTFKIQNFNPFSEIYLGLLIELPSDGFPEGKEIPDGFGYSRIAIRSKLGFYEDGSLTNEEPIVFNGMNIYWPKVVGIGIYYSNIGSGNQILYKAIKSIEKFKTLNWQVGSFSISYSTKLLVISEWDDRPKSNVPEGYELIFGPTNCLYKFNKNVGDFVRVEYYDLFVYDLKAELSGNYLPLDEPDYPWDSYTGDSDVWSVFNDGTYNWCRLNSMSKPTGSTSGYRINKELFDNIRGSYFFQGWIHVPSKSGQQSSNTAALNIFGARPDENRASYTFSAHNNPHQNRIAHVSTASANGPYFYLSPTTNTAPVWLETYFITNKENNSLFKSLIYISHNLEPFHYYDETFPAVVAPYNLTSVAYGDLGADNLDMRARDFKFCNLWNRQ